MLPSALAAWDAIAARLDGRRPALFLDYDGTLSPLVERPELAVLPDAAREVLGRLAARFPVVIVSGRGREDVAERVGLPDLVYAGSHGFDIAGPRQLRLEVGDGVPAAIERAAGRLERELSGIIQRGGVIVEPKRFAISVHFRLAAAADVPAIERAVDAALAAEPALRKGHGKKLFELRPDLDWDKGRALLWLLGELGLDAPDVLPVYLGDDLTDEDAFRAVRGRGIGILVGDPGDAEETPRETAATYRLRDPAEVVAWLERLLCSRPASDLAGEADLETDS